MNNQEIFDIVWNGLKSQKFERSMAVPSFSLGPMTCAYRGENGRKCAAGWLISDKEHSDPYNFEPIHNHPWFKENFNEAQLNFIRSLQLSHDENETQTGMMNSLCNVAMAYHLRIPE